MAVDIYESALEQMSADSLDIDEMVYQPPPAKTKTSIVLSAATKRQLAWLEQAGHGKQSEVIALAVDRMWRDETRAGRLSAK